jgi:hypothetical protein
METQFVNAMLVSFPSPTLSLAVVGNASGIRIAEAVISVATIAA